MNDEYFMRKALEQAKLAYSLDEVPIGCVIVKDNNKNLWSWGSNSYGILGIGEGSSLYVPTKLNDNENIVFYGKDIEELYLQGNYYVVKTSDGKLYRYQKESMPI